MENGEKAIGEEEEEEEGGGGDGDEMTFKYTHCTVLLTVKREEREGEKCVRSRLMIRLNKILGTLYIVVSSRVRKT